MIDLSNYRIYENKDGRLRAYNKTTHKVTSYPRVLMEAILGRPLLPTEDVHHKDENPKNNNPDNLEVIDHLEHDKLHGELNRKYFDKTMVCPVCNKEFLWTAQQQQKAKSNNNKKGRKNKPHDGPFCSNRCKGINNQRKQAEQGRVSKYHDKITICAGCGKPFLYSAKSQRGHRAESRDKPYCSIQCVYKSNTKYTDNIIKEIQESLYRNNGSFAKTEREFGIPRGRLHDILKRHGVPFYKKDYMKFSA